MVHDVIAASIRIFSISMLRYFIVAGVPFLICYKLLNNDFKKAKIQNKQVVKIDYIRELLHSMQTTFVFTLIALIVLFSPLKQYTLIYNDINDYPFWWVGLSLVLSLILQDSYFYWMHRLLHHKKIFRFTHLIHHKSTNPTPWTSYSFHFLEAWAEGLVLILIVFILPMHLLTIILFTLVGFMFNVYGHLGYEIAPQSFRNSFLFKILNSSVYHNLHHSKFNGNYGLYFRIWDKLMNTENPDYEKQYDKIQQQRFGAETILKLP